jgi:hypothetical protein
MILPSELPGGAPIRQWDGAMPVIMSANVLLLIAAELWKYGPPVPHHDEGTIDHIAILLMFGQIPIMFWFAASGRRLARHVAPTLAIQLSLWAITFALAVGLTWERFGSRSAFAREPLDILYTQLMVSVVARAFARIQESRRDQQEHDLSLVQRHRVGRCDVLR